MVVRRAFVTGATGGLGRALVPALISQGYEVVALGRNLEVGQELTAAGAQFIEQDLTAPFEPSLLQGSHVIFHLAALSAPWGKSETFKAINVAATQALCDAAQTVGVDCFIFTSTPSIYASSYHRFELTDKDSPASPFANKYAQTKFEAEQIVRAAKGFYRIIIRPRAIVGPNDTVLLPRLMKALKRPVFPLPNRGRAQIELTDVRDVVAALIAADKYRDKADGLAFNISGGRALELRQILTILTDKLGHGITTLPVPASALMGLSHFLQWAARLLPGQPEPPLTPYIVKTLSFSQTFDLTKAKNILGWMPRYTAEEAIDAALEGSLG